MSELDATYLRIKNFAEFQHYDPLLRTPPWIKQHVALLDDLDFLRLDEFTQWQLGRIWLVAARSTAVTFDENQVIVPVVANDAMSLQRAISSVKKVPLALLIREGWLIPVDEEDLLSAEQIASAPSRKQKRASKAKQSPTGGDALARRSHGASTVGDKGGPRASAPLRGRGSEVSELGSLPGRHSKRDGLPETINPENQFLVARLIAAIGDHADDGTHHVVSGIAAKLPPSSLAKVFESLAAACPRDRAAYVVGALRGELEERSAA